MSLTQKLLALFGCEFVVIVVDGTAYVVQVCKVGSYWATYWNGSILAPAGILLDRPDAKWEPLTKGVTKFYNGTLEG